MKRSKHRIAATYAGFVDRSERDSIRICVGRLQMTHYHEQAGALPYYRS